MITLARQPRLLALAALGGLALLALEPVRLAMEASMSRHMLLQFPSLLLVGFLLGGAIPLWWRTALAPWNRYGISGLCAAGLILECQVPTSGRLLRPCVPRSLPWAANRSAAGSL